MTREDREKPRPQDPPPTPSPSPSPKSTPPPSTASTSTRPRASPCCSPSSSSPSRPTTSSSTPCASTTPAPQTKLFYGDALCLSIAAASVVAKVYRDALMRELDEQYPAVRPRRAQRLRHPRAPPRPHRARPLPAPPPQLRPRLALPQTRPQRSTRRSPRKRRPLPRPRRRSRLRQTTNPHGPPPLRRARPTPRNTPKTATRCLARTSRSPIIGTRQLLASIPSPGEIRGNLSNRSSFEVRPVNSDNEHIDDQGNLRIAGLLRTMDRRQFHSAVDCYFDLASGGLQRSLSDSRRRCNSQ